MQEASRQGCAVGLAFHVGSQCRSPEAYVAALDLLGEVIAKADVQPACIDVGGGFPAAYGDRPVPSLDAYMEAVRRGLKELRLSPTVEIFAEPGRALVRSEEHTSELQSLMRISYAVFCLKQTTQNRHMTSAHNPCTSST